MAQRDFKELYQLLNALREDVITDEQFDRLDELIKSDHQACQIYVDYVKLWADLVSVQVAAKPGLDQTLALSAIETDSLLDSKLWQALGEDEKQAVAVIIDKPESAEVSSVDDFQSVGNQRQISRLSIYTLILSAAAVILLMVMVILTPQPPIVARLSDSIGAEWAPTGEVPEIGDVLREGEMTLLDGLAEITFGNDAVVVIEAPAKFELTGVQSLFLESGKVSALVNDYVMGFEVDTPSAKIIDLGTQFGVSVFGDGSCSLDMFRGKANFVAGVDGKKRSSEIVNVNEARSVDFSTGQMKVKVFEKVRFARHIDSKRRFVWRGKDINLADVVGGGSGFGNELTGRCINLSTGVLYLRLKSGERYTDNQYHPSVELPFVDGVFVPDGGEGPVQVTSAGHLWEDCPDTTGIFYEGIYTGSRTRVSVRHGFVLNDVKYGTVEHPAIVTHTNAGVTFDIALLRPTLADLKIVRFEALCGVSQDAKQAYPGNVSDFYVLVDGEKRFEAKGVGVLSGPKNVSVELSKEDRFLTLISTDGDMTPNHDWSFYAEPRLVLE